MEAAEKKRAKCGFWTETSAIMWVTGGNWWPFAEGAGQDAAAGQAGHCLELADAEGEEVGAPQWLGGGGGSRPGARKPSAYQCG